MILGDPRIGQRFGGDAAPGIAGIDKGDLHRIGGLGRCDGEGKRCGERYRQAGKCLHDDVPHLFFDLQTVGIETNSSRLACEPLHYHSLYYERF